MIGMHRSKSDLIDTIIKYGQLKYLEGMAEERDGDKQPFHIKALLKLEQIEDIIYNEL